MAALQNYEGCYTRLVICIGKRLRHIRGTACNIYQIQQSLLFWHQSVKLTEYLKACGLWQEITGPLRRQVVLKRPY